MATIADVQALPATDAAKIVVGTQLLFRGVSNVVLQVVEGQKHFAIGQIYTVEEVKNLLGLGHIVKVQGVDGFHFTNLFADVPAGFTLDTAPAETQDQVLDVVHDVEADAEKTDAGQTAEAVVPEVVQAADAAATVVPVVEQAATAVIDAAPAVIQAADAVASATAATAEVVQAAETAAPAVEAAVTAATDEVKS